MGALGLMSGPKAWELICARARVGSGYQNSWPGMLDC